MLNRAVSSPTWTPNRWTDVHRGLSDRQAALVRRYVLLVVILSALGCVYLWQVNVITELRQKTWAMRDQIVEVEGSNAVLMLQLARWESPSHIELAANAAGWRRADMPTYVQVSSSDEALTSDIQQIASTQTVR
jgi:hypothetical protein